MCWANNVPEMRMLQGLCDGLHKHAPWVQSAIFGNASPEVIVEAEVCDILCDRALDCIIRNAVSRGLYPDTKSVTRAILEGRAVALQKQLRGFEARFLPNPAICFLMMAS